MAKKLVKHYIERAAVLEITLGGKETIVQLKGLIQKEMESLDTWDGDHFENKAAAPAEEDKPADDSAAPESDDSPETADEATKTDDDDTTDSSKDSSDEAPQDGASDTDGGETPAQDEKGDESGDGDDADGDDAADDGEDDVDKEEAMREVIGEASDEQLKQLMEKLTLEVSDGEDWRAEGLQAVVAHDHKLVAEAVSELADEWNEAEALKVDNAIDHMKKPELIKLVEELNVKKTGTVKDLVERLAAIQTDDLALAIEALDLWPEEEAEISEETAAARAERELIAKREKVQEDGIEAAMKMVNYFQACDDLEGALDLVVLSMDLWPKSSELSSRRKTIMTLIDDRDTAKTAYELEQSQAKLEKKNKELMKIRGRAAKEITNDQCVEAVNAAITVIRDRARQQHLKGKASVRYRSAAQILTRVVGLNLR